MSIQWSNEKKDLWLSNTTFSTNDENLSLMGLYRGYPNVNNGSESIKELGNPLLGYIR